MNSGHQRCNVSYEENTHAHTHTYTLHTGASGEGVILKVAVFLEPKKLIRAISCLISFITKATFPTSPMTVIGSYQSSETRTQVTCDVTDPVCVQYQSHLLFFQVFIFFLPDSINRSIDVGLYI